MDIQLHPLIEACVWVAFLMGGAMCIANFSLPVRYYLKVWRKEPLGPNVSAIPILGSLIVYLTLRVLGTYPVVEVIGYVLIAIDMGGIHWMIVGIGWAVFREIRQRLLGTKIDSKGPSINPAAVIILILIALAFLLKAFG